MSGFCFCCEHPHAWRLEWRRLCYSSCDRRLPSVHTRAAGCNGQSINICYCTVVKDKTTDRARADVSISKSWNFDNWLLSQRHLTFKIATSTRPWFLNQIISRMQSRLLFPTPTYVPTCRMVNFFSPKLELEGAPCEQCILAVDHLLVPLRISIVSIIRRQGLAFFNRFRSSVTCTWRWC
jgi:hypothetical protein